MSKTRTPRRGSVFFDKSKGKKLSDDSRSGRWVSQLIYEMPDGTVTKQAPSFATKREAELSLRRLDHEQALAAGEIDDFYLKAACEQYMEARETGAFRGKGGKRNSTKSVQGEQKRCAWLVEVFGNARLRDITVQQIEKMSAGLSEGVSPSGRKLSRHTIKQYHMTLKNIFTFCGRLDDTLPDPVTRAMIYGTTTKPKRVALTKDELDLLISSAELERIKRLAVLGGLYGLRPAEARALRWSDINDGVLYVRRQASTGYGTTEVKTKGSLREVRFYHEIQKSSAEDSDDFVLNIEDDKKLRMVSTYTLRSQLIRSCKLLKIPEITIYELRHTAFTHLVAKGNSATNLAQWGGTSVRMLESTYFKQTGQVRDVDR